MQKQKEEYLKKQLNECKAHIVSGEKALSNLIAEKNILENLLEDAKSKNEKAEAPVIEIPPLNQTLDEIKKSLIKSVYSKDLGSLYLFIDAK